MKDFKSETSNCGTILRVFAMKYSYLGPLKIVCQKYSYLGPFLNVGLSLQFWITSLFTRYEILFLIRLFVLKHFCHTFPQMWNHCALLKYED